MKELIKITEQNGKQAVSARELHAFLGSKKQFSDWIKDRIRKYGFIENVDYQSFSLIGENGGRSIEYPLSMSCAKEIAMVEGNAKGKQARQYFIACEEKAKQQSKPLSQLDYLQQQLKIMIEHDNRLNTVESKVLQLEAKTQTRPDYFTIVGYGTLKGIHIGLPLAGSLGRKASRICSERGIKTDKIPDPRFGEVKMYPTKVLDEIFSQPIN